MILDKIDAYVKEQGISQRKFIDLLEISPVWFHKLKRFENMPTEKIVARIAELIGESEEYVRNEFGTNCKRKHDHLFMEMALTSARKSKEPVGIGAALVPDGVTTQTWAVASCNREIVGGVILTAEMAAIVDAVESKKDIAGASLYVTKVSINVELARLLVALGVREVVYMESMNDKGLDVLKSSGVLVSQF